MVRFIKEFSLSIQCYWHAIKFIVEQRLYWYFSIPAALMLLIYQAGHYLLQFHIEPNLSNLNGMVWYFIIVSIEISISLLLMKFAKYLVVILLSPLLSYLSQRCDEILTGNEYHVNFQQILHDVKRGIRLAVRNILWEYLIFFTILGISSIFWEEPTKSPLFYLTFIVGFYYYGFSFIDYDNERNKLSEHASVIFVRSHRGLAMGIGCIYSLLILVPVDLKILFSIGDYTSSPLHHYSSVAFHLLLWISASIAPIIAIVASALAMARLKKENNKYQSTLEQLTI